MDGRKKCIALGLVSLSFFWMSCEQTTVEEDMNAYCDCISQHGGLMNEECADLAKEITRKYEYDPEAVETIEQSIRNCGVE
jgi:hypothetical protein